MPDNTALTKTPFPLLGDAANIETAVKPGLQNLEKYAIPRFTSASARNAAFALSPPSKGQLVYIQSGDHLGYEVWDGTSWVEFGDYTRLRIVRSIINSHIETNSGSFQTLMSVNVTPGNWQLSSVVYYQWLESELPGNEFCIFGCDFPETASSSGQIFYHGLQKQTSGQASSFNQITQVDARTTGSFDMEVGLRNTVDVIGVVFEGMLLSTGSGTVSMRVRKDDFGDGTVRYRRGSWMRLMKM